MFSSLGFKNGPAALLLLALLLLTNRAAGTEDFVFGDPIVEGKLDSDQIVEASGLVVSHTNAGVMYVHNDSGDTARLFAIDYGGHLLTELNLTKTKVIDCEDIAIGPGPVTGIDYIYLGDIGDNQKTRESIFVYRFPEPSKIKQGMKQHYHINKPERIELRYEDTPHNAEALMIDPLSGDLFIATKTTAFTTLYRASAEDLNTQSAITLHKVALIPLGGLAMITAGDISKDGRKIILRGYTQAFFWNREVGQSIPEAMKSDLQRMTLKIEPQGEAISWDIQGLGFYTTSEGKNQPLLFYPRKCTPENQGVTILSE